MEPLRITPISHVAMIAIATGRCERFMCVAGFLTAIARSIDIAARLRMELMPRRTSRLIRAWNSSSLIRSSSKIKKRLFEGIIATTNDFNVVLNICSVVASGGCVKGCYTHTYIMFSNFCLHCWIFG